MWILITAQNSIIIAIVTKIVSDIFEKFTKNDLKSRRVI